MNIFQKICLAFTIIGGINWGLIGLFNFNLVTWITQGENMVSRVIYTIVGLCSIINILIFFFRLAPMTKENEII
jgi:uncharacterized membrane protein YuzA (DUF378 family)